MENKEFLEKLSASDQAWLTENPDLAAKAIYDARRKDIFGPEEAVTTPPRDEAFTTGKFHVASKEVLIADIGKGFKTSFLLGRKKEIKSDKPSLNQKICSTMVKANVSSEQIIRRLKKRLKTGGELTMTLKEIYELLVAQPYGKPGPLMTDGKNNIFYVVTANNELLAVCVSWHDFCDYPGWAIGVNTINNNPYVKKLKVFYKR